MTGLIHDQKLQKQVDKPIGCMSGFLQIFDRHQILAGKRVHSTKRLPASTGVAASPESVKSVQSTAIMEIEKQVPAERVVPDGLKPSPAETPSISPRPLRIFELKEGSMKYSWKFCKDMPRLSLDSRATVDSKGSLCAREIRIRNGTASIDESFDNQGRSPSVIARLMGVEQLPSSDLSSSPETVTEPELRRSASESRVSRELFPSRFIDGNNFSQLNRTGKQPAITNRTSNESARDNEGKLNAQNGRVTRNQNESPKTFQRRSFFDSADIFPETKQATVRIYGDSGKSLKMTCINERFKDLETLKHILEAMQLKGLLHSKIPLNRDSHRNFVYDRSLLSDDSNKQWRSPASHRSFGRVNRYSGNISPPISPRLEHEAINRSGRSPVRARNSSAHARIEINSKNCNTNEKRKPLSIETKNKYRESSESRRNSPTNSPKLTPKRSGLEHHSVTNRSPRSKRPTEKVYSKKLTRTFVEEDESSSVSENSGGTNSKSDRERSKVEEYKEGRSLLARCDKLLHSITKMNSITESHTSSNSVLPSPVSVLDSAFDKDESSSPSPVTKRTIDFEDLTIDQEDDIWSSVISPAKSTNDEEEEFISGDSDFKYISEILRASKHIPYDSSIFISLEKQRSSNDLNLRQKLVFDTVAEIIDRKRELPPWNFISGIGSSNSVKQICSEFQKIREPVTAENLLDLICTVLKRDLAGNNGWGDQPVEVSEAVLHIERLIFKDLVSEIIQDLAEFSGKTTVFLPPRRKLVF